jgi:4-diphosphocytidyl-2-C-methyl-D-erythritol kinase
MGVGGTEAAAVVVVEAPAKLNIHLSITGRRPDGYHELISVMVPVGLADRIQARAVPEEGVDLSCSGRSVPQDDTNLARRAARAFLSSSGLRQGISIHLHKEIPVAAGLGGGSSDAAAVLVAMNRLWPGRLNEAGLFRLALGLGADVPFFLHPAPSLARGIGEDLERLDYWPDLCYVLVNPPVEVSTSWVYGQVEIELTSPGKAYIFKALNQDTFSIRDLLKNDLERVTESRFPVVTRIKKELLEAGAEGALMTGSGPTVFGVFYGVKQAEEAAEKIIPRGLGDVFVIGGWAGDRFAGGESID